MTITKREIARVANKFFLILVIFVCETCVTTKSRKSARKFYSIKRFEANGNGSYLSVNFYQYKNKEKSIPAFYYINGIVFGPKKNLKFDIINVRPGAYHIIAGFVGKKKTQTQVNVDKGDSVIVRMYLKGSSEPLY